MISTKDDFMSIAAMMQSDGWKLFREHIEILGKNALKSAEAELNDRERARHLDRYATYKRVLSDVLSEYKEAYEKYQGE